MVVLLVGGGLVCRSDVASKPFDSPAPFFFFSFFYLPFLIPVDAAAQIAADMEYAQQLQNEFLRESEAEVQRQRAESRRQRRRRRKSAFLFRLMRDMDGWVGRYLLDGVVGWQKN